MRRPRAEHERGSVVLLFPVAVLVMLLMAAAVVDLALVQLRSRQLAAVAASAANDALAALDVAALRRGEGIVIPTERAHDVVTDAVRAGPLPRARIERVTVDPDPAGRLVVTVTLELDVELVMTPQVADLHRVTLRRAEAAVIVTRPAP